jgi:HTH-type transcriptional repressor of NAD biosynthesis genes
MKLDNLALKGSNKIVFFDTDAVVTQYYCELYLGKSNPNIERYVDPSKYDVVFILAPTVKWVDDGLRFKSDQGEREVLHKRIVQMYADRGFENIVVIDDNNNSYNYRLRYILNHCDLMLK